MESGTRIVRFEADDGKGPCYGVWHDDHLRVMPASPFEGYAGVTEESLSAEAVSLLAPCTPTKIVAVGLNYRDHAAELGMALPEEPLLFLKPPSSVIGPGAAIVIPSMSRRVDYEGELAVVIGLRTSNIAPGEAGRYIIGYTCLNDVTARDLQQRDGQFTRAKGFDTFCPVGPWIATGLDTDDLGVECLVNGKVRQSSTTGQLIHRVPELVSFISRVMTLFPGDVIATGTPSGIGPLHRGDEVCVRIEGIGDLRNSVC